MNWLIAPWPWYIGGPLIGLTVPLLLLLVGKSFGVSSSLHHLCSMSMPRTKVPYLKENNWVAESWNIFFVVGILLGAYIGTNMLSVEQIALLPDHFDSARGMVGLFVGGILVGFGTRYADGCTSGHAIMGLSTLKWPSLVATLSFFVGGLFIVGISCLFT